MIKLKSEEQLLDIEFRKKVIDDILGPDNVQRKQRELRKHEIYRDEIKKWVVEALAKDGLKAETIQQMQNRSASISFCRKVINKKARSYLQGVERKAKDDKAKAQVDALEKLLDPDTRCKKADRYRELHKNTVMQVIPELASEDEGKYNLKIRVFSAHQYDVLPDYADCERAKAYILSDFYEGLTASQSLAAQPIEARHGIINALNVPEHMADQSKRQFIWWSKKYHFTTDDKGSIISELTPKDQANPIQEMPFVNIAEDQDGKFWAVGGEDLVDGSVLLNLLLTDMNAIAYIQGWGQLVVRGKNLPKHIEGGPHTAITLDQDTGDPTPDANFISANPPLGDWMAMIEQYCALMLSTNDLSPAAVSGKLDAREAPSGIALLIEQSEATNNIEDKQKIFKKAERILWRIISKWQSLYAGLDLLSAPFKEIGKMDDPQVEVTFLSAKPVITEKEKLENIKTRQDIGINTKLDLIKLDNPGISDEDAKKKLKEILEEKLKNVASAMNRAIMNAGAQNASKEKSQGDEASGEETEEVIEPSEAVSS